MLHIINVTYPLIRVESERTVRTLCKRLFASLSIGHALCAMSAECLNVHQSAKGGVRHAGGTNTKRSKNQKQEARMNAHYFPLGLLLTSAASRAMIVLTAIKASGKE